MALVVGGMSPLRRRYPGLLVRRPKPDPRRPFADAARSGANTARSGAASKPDPSARSEEACPVCGKHALSLLDFPYVATMGVQPYADILGMGELPVSQEPGIGCLECGTQWASLDDFRSGGPGTIPPPAPRTS